MKEASVEFSQKSIFDLIVLQAFVYIMWRLENAIRLCCGAAAGRERCSFCALLRDALAMGAVVRRQ